MRRQHTATARIPSFCLAFALALVLGLAPLAAPSAHASETVRTIGHELAAGTYERLGFEGTVGEVALVGVAGDTVRIDLEIRCERKRDDACRRAAERVNLRLRERGGRIELEVDDWPKLHNKRISMFARLEVPRHLAVEIGMGVGEVEVEGTESDVEIDLGVGEIRVEMREAFVRSIELDTGVGEALLRTGERTIDGSGFVGSHLSWRDGPGDARIEIDTGVGEIEVTLR